MVKTKPDGLKGGRAALYRGPEAYASQTFENDTRAQKLSGFLSAYCTNQQSFTANVQIEVNFPTVITPYVQSPVMRQFARVPNSNSRFIALKDCTCELSGGAALTNATTNLVLSCYISIQRGGTIVHHVIQGEDRSSTAVLTFINLYITPRIVDIKRGDIIYMEIVNGGANSTTIFDMDVIGAEVFLQSTSLYLKEIT